ncbi:ribulose-bisphosphate carboxylase large subunit, partial [Candidatus Bathyarchaeota archaeon]|nr:ribulose-bisphosphate carboxylase large subunit [Candidatus Bathyarchaeota archaeon]
MKYVDFVDQSYTPKTTDIICNFFVEPDGISLKEAAGGVAAESSVGTWTELTTLKPYVEDLAACVFDINGNNIQVAYSSELFEKGNMPNILSSVAGNVFGLRTLKNLRLNDIFFPRDLVQSFESPEYGIAGIRRLLDVKDR